MERQRGELYLGEEVDAQGERTGEHTLYDATDLTTHGVIVGMTGSGKTGLGVIAIEEALLSGIPVLVLDPKGDMGNLALTFPALEPGDFQPWVNVGDAQREGSTVEEYAGQQAKLWRGGLERSGLGASDLAALRDAAEVTIYTPGSEAGVPLNVIGDLAAPAGAADSESLREEASAFVSGLLRLVDVDDDPLSSREHILLANLIEHAWSEGRDLDLAALLQQIIDPPLRKLGVFEVDTFFPANDRRTLAMRLNALLASPTFAAWTVGEPVDIERLLHTHDGRPRASVLYLAHLSEAERQFVVTLVLSKLVTWMRAQSGTTDLRALVYMDEVFGFAPPTAEPPSKRTILTLMKQARAFGVGMLLSTQNPVDLDYKVMSNAGTWMIGRLQTERDKARVLEALSSASGEVDLKEIDARISGLGSRHFLLHNTHDRGGPKVFTTRWAMSYLRGPLTRDQISSLSEGARSAAESPPAMDVPSTPAAQPSEPDAPLPEDVSRVQPETAKGVPVYVADPAAPWARDLGAVPGGTRLEPAIVAQVHLLFDERGPKLRHTEEWEAVLYPLEARLDVASAVTVDYDARDLRPEIPEGATFALPDAPIAEAAFFRDLQRDLRDYLLRERKLHLQHNPALKLSSRVGESPEEFARRCDEAAQAAADEEASKLRDRYDTKMDRVRDAIESAQDRVEQLETDTSSRRGHEVVAAVGDLLGSFFGGRRTTRSIATSAGRVAKGASSRRSTSARTEQRLRTAKDKLEGEVEELEEVEEELLEELQELDEEWAERAREIEDLEVPLEQSDIKIDEVALVWLPMA